MNAHLIDTSGHKTVVRVAAFPKQPLIVRHHGKDYAVNNPGFTFFGGPSVGSYMEYHEAWPLSV